MLIRETETVDMMESSIDFPKTDLPKDIWDKDGESYVLKPDVKDKILQALATYPKLQLVEWADEIRLVGSITSNQYEKGADIDVHLVGDASNSPGGMSAEELKGDVYRFFKKADYPIGDFHIEVYTQTNPPQDYMSVGVYNLKNDQWEKGPDKKEQGFNPYEAYEEIFDKIKTLAKEADLKLGELKRDVIDYDVIAKALSYVPNESKAKIKEELQKRLDEIEEDIKVLMKDKLEWINARKLASSPTTREQALNDLELAKEFGEKNAIFKFLNRYQYIKVISVLEKMIEDDNINAEEMDKLQSLLGVLTNV